MKIILDHLVLNVADARKAAEFYQNVLCFQVERFDKFERGVVPFPSVRINEETVIDLFPPKMWKVADAENEAKNINLNHFCVTLAEHDWHELILRLKSHSIAITRYADDNWGALGIGISVYFNDLDGNEIEARYYPSE